MLLCSASQGRGLPKISGGWRESFGRHPTALSHSRDQITKQKFNPSITAAVIHHVQGSIAMAPHWAHILSPWLIPWSSKWRADTWKDSLHSGIFAKQGWGGSHSVSWVSGVCLTSPGNLVSVTYCLILPPQDFLMRQSLGLKPLITTKSLAWLVWLVEEP